ncbi:MAG: HEAT repeat domain-containing protein [Candidatus Heimdallarchaeota archaeon]
MSEESKNLLLRLKKEKKVNKQIDLVQKLKDHNQEEMVNHVLLVHLERKDHDSLRLEILTALNFDDEKIVSPLASIISDPYESIAVKEKAIALLGENKSKNAMKSLLKVYRKAKDPKILDNLALALTFFQDTSVIKPIIKALHHEELRLPALTGLARNESTVYSSKDLMKALAHIEITKQFELLHYNKIIENILQQFKLASKEELLQAFKSKKFDQAIITYLKEQAEITKMLKKVKI